MSEITLEILRNNEFSKELEGFVEESSNGTIFHSPRFLSYHNEAKFRAQGGEVNHLLFRKKGRLIAFLPSMLFIREYGKVLKSPYGGSYGGYVYDELSFAEALEVVEISLQYFRESGIRQVEVVPTPPLYARDGFIDYFPYLLLKSGFRIWKADLLIVCKMSLTMGCPLTSLKKNAKKFMAQALRNNVTVRDSDDLDSFYSILLSNRAKFDVLPTHSREELDLIKKLYPAETLLFMAYIKELPVAGALLFACNSRVINCFYLCHKEDYSDLRPNNLLVPAILCKLARHGYEWLDFGPSSFGYEPHDSLVRYKESFGGKGVCRYYYHLDL